ncbi:c-type cytochrome [Sphingomonas sp. MMS24-J45]|uniref:c-type cytochrome n=1 Tax=Sphingomonas sp. MMS24-J45 TaxID=3238806 RepID=UPI00384C1E20
MTRSILAYLFPRRIIQWTGPLAATGVAMLVVVVIVLGAGWVDLSASIPHPAGWATILHGVFRRSTAYHSANFVPPKDFGSPSQIAKGAGYYGRVCARCHGGPGLGQNPVALSMRPRPQYLPQEVADFKPRELFWIVKHGVKYSAMPSWPVQDRDDEVWSVVSFLKAMPKMSTAQFRTLAYGDPAARNAGPPQMQDDRAPLKPYTLPNKDAPPLESLYAAPAAGFDDLAMGGSLIASCAGCHGADGAGRGTGAVPNIALLTPEYLRTALRKYRSGVRHSGFMQTVAVQLTDPQIDALARYYASQPKRQSQPVTASAAQLALGARIATAGDARRGVGACTSCHGQEGASPKGFSALDGQFPTYLADQLRLFRAGIRGHEPGNMMRGAASRLSDAEIDAVSLYYGARAPRNPQRAATVVH